MYSVLETFAYFACAHSTPHALAYVHAQPPRHKVIKRTDDRRLTPCRKRVGAFRPRISPRVRAPGSKGVNPAVSRHSGPSSAWNERKRLGEPVLLFLRDDRTSEKCEDRFHVKINAQSGIIRPDRADLSRSRLRAGGRERPSVETSATGHGLHLSAGAAELTGTYSGVFSIVPIGVAAHLVR